MNNSFETEMNVASEGTGGGSDDCDDMRNFTDIELQRAMTNTFATT